MGDQRMNNTQVSRTLTIGMFLVALGGCDQADDVGGMSGTDTSTGAAETSSDTVDDSTSGSGGEQSGSGQGSASGEDGGSTSGGADDGSSSGSDASTAGDGDESSSGEPEPTCEDGVRNGDETDVDCGGPTCDVCESGAACLEPTDCASGVCEGELCLAPSCGDGVVQDGETCDDAGESADCNADCSVAACGDGIVNPTAGEDCDAFGEQTETCEATCSSAACGDGVVNELAGEACDDGGESFTCWHTCVAKCDFDESVLPSTVSAFAYGEIDIDGFCHLVTGGNGNFLRVVRTDTGAVVNRAILPNASGVLGIAYDHNDDLVYATTGSGRLMSVDADAQVDDIMALPSTFQAIEMIPEGFGAYGGLIIGVSGQPVTGNVYVIDPVNETTEILGTAGAQLFTDLAFNFDGEDTELLLVSLFNGNVLSMDEAGTFTLVADLPNGTHDAIETDGTRAVVTSSSGPLALYEIDLESAAVTTTPNPFAMDGGSYPSGIVFDAAGDLIVKVSASGTSVREFSLD